MDTGLIAHSLAWGVKRRGGGGGAPAHPLPECTEGVEKRKLVDRNQISMWNSGAFGVKKFFNQTRCLKSNSIRLLYIWRTCTRGVHRKVVLTRTEVENVLKDGTIMLQPPHPVVEGRPPHSHTASGGLSNSMSLQ